MFICGWKLLLLTINEGWKHKSCNGFLFAFHIFLINFFFFLATLRGRRDLGSLTRDGTAPPAVEAWNLNHWTAREFPFTFHI